MAEKSNRKRRTYGEHLTPIQIFKEFILPEIKDKLYNYVWVDMFAGKGNLILPILEFIQKKLVEQAIENALRYGIPEKIAKQKIVQRDTIKDYPKFLLDLELPIYHTTNPPYL